MESGPTIAVTALWRDSAASEEAGRLCRELRLPRVDVQETNTVDLLLAVTENGLELRDAADPGTRGVLVDFRSIDLRTGTGNLSRRQPLGRAFGRETRTVVDATAGLGHDAALLACMGYHVTAIERSPIIAALLSDGIRRAACDEALRKLLVPHLRLRVGDAREILANQSSAVDRPDAVFLDPIFPAKRKASALPKKSIRLVRRLVGDDADAGELFTAAIRAAERRVVVKRPHHAPPLGGEPAFTISAKLVRYDVYITAVDR
jgi:16S rRNA (guanine1516-N2)-methyltransferase